jgi:hypothetical protein
MSDEPKQTEDEQPDEPDGRGKRPTDPNELAKWLIEQTTSGSNDNSGSDGE